MTSPVSFELRRDSSFELCNVPLLFTPLLGISTILPGPLPPPPDAVVPDDGRVTILPPSPSLSTPVLPTLLPPVALVPDGGRVTILPPSPSLSTPILPVLLPPVALVPDGGRATILPPSPSLSTPILPVLLPPVALVPDEGNVESLPPSPSLSRPSLPAEEPPTAPCGMMGFPSLFSAKICFGCESGIIFGCTASFRALCA